MKDWRIMTVLLLCLVLVGSMACNLFGGDEEEVNQQLVEVVRGDLTVSVSGSGNIDVANEVSLAFGSGGKVDKIYVKEGDKVSKGEILAKLDTGALELALTQAQVSLELAKFNLYRMEDVAEAQDKVDEAECYVKCAETKLTAAYRTEAPEGIKYWKNEVLFARVSLLEAQQELAEILADPDYAGLVINELVIKKLQVKAAEQAVIQAQKQLDEATTTAPFDGVVASVGVDEGETVSATTTIVQLIDLTSIQLKVEVDEIDIPSVRQGQKAVIDVDALPELQLEGKVTYISLLPEVEAGVTVYEVKISLDVPHDLGLKVGMSATADIIIDERSNVLLVPSRAIKLDSQGNTVVEVMVDGQIQERPVVIGISDGYQTEIVDGLDEGELVVRKAS